MKKIFTCILVAMLAMPMLAKGPILSESFSYELGDLYGNGGWVKYSTNANEPIQVVNNPLTYTDYQDQAVGYAVKVAGGQNSGQDLWKRMDANVSPINSGSVYASFLMNVESAGSYSGGIFFFTLASTGSIKEPGDGGSPANQGRIFVAPSTNDGKFILAVTKNGGGIVTTTPATQTAELNLNQTYLVVLKYTWVEGTKNDNVQVWINPIKDAEPATATLTYADASSADFSYGIIGVQLRQAGTPERKEPHIIVDQIRMATNWADLFVQATDEDVDDTTPVISASPSNLEFTGFKIGETNKKTISVTAANLTEGITITKTTDAISLSKTSITLEELAAGSVSVEVTINASQEADFTDVITFTSGETVEDVDITATVWEPEKEDVMSFEALSNKGSVTDIIFTYKGFSAHIMSVNETYKQISLIDNSEKSVKVQLTDAQWEAINPVNGMKVKSFIFTAEFTGTLVKTALCTPITLTFKDADFSREMTSTNLATICLKGDVSNFAQLQEQATFYKILYKQEYEGEVYNIVLEEVNTNMEAGKPYIFQPKEPCTMEFYYSATTDYAGNANGLIGTFSQIDVEEGMYILYDNKIRQAGEGCTLAANRAYINMSQVPTESQAEPQNVAMRHLTLQNMDANISTNLHHTQSLKTPKKYIVKGRLILENNGAKINVLGQSLK